MAAKRMQWVCGKTSQLHDLQIEKMDGQMGGQANTEQSDGWTDKHKDRYPDGWTALRDRHT